MRLSDGSDLGTCYETIAPPDHSLGPCPEGFIWVQHIRRWISPPNTKPRIRAQWIQAKLPPSIDEVSAVIGLVRGLNGVVWWEGLYLSELTRKHFALPASDWVAVEKWVAELRMAEFKAKALEYCREQHAANLKAAATSEQLPLSGKESP